MVFGSMWLNHCSSLTGKREQKYAVPLEGTGVSGSSAIYRSSSAVNKDLKEFCHSGEYESYWGMLRESCKRFGTLPCLGTRAVDVDGKLGKYEWMTYDETRDLALDFGRGLLILDCLAHVKADSTTECYGSEFTFLGISAKNRKEWTIADIACSAFAITSIPLYDTLGDEAIEHIVNQTKLRAICGDTKCITHFLKLGTEVPTIKILICFDPITNEHRDLAQQRGVALHTFDEVVAHGKDSKTEVPKENPDFISTICYTSGTTGKPKGVVLLNKNLTSTGACALAKPDMFRVAPGDYHISYLPLAHIYERIVQYYFILQGGAIGYYSGDTLKLLDDIQELRPTIFCSVPRLFNKIIDKVQSGVNDKSALVQWLFNTAIKAKLANYRSSGQLTHPLFDKIVFAKIQKLLGGRVRYMTTGSAPLEKTVQEKVACFFSCQLLEGWGMTETCGLSMVQGINDHTKGQLGGLLPGLEFKVKSVPEMNYDAENLDLPRGELLIRGPPCFIGYFANVEETAKAIDEDGWLCTGDIVSILKTGAVQIIDRKKSIYKLSQGEYVAPEKIESVYQQTPLIAQIFVHGNSNKNYLVAVVVPDEDAASKWARKHGKHDKDHSLANLIKDEELKIEILNEMEGVVEDKLKGFEKVKNIHLSAEPFSIDNDMLTATFKMVRHKAYQGYKEEIDKLYSEDEKVKK